MTILSIVTDQIGQIGQHPRRVKMVTTDDYAAILMPGYLNSSTLLGYTLYKTDLIDMIYSYDTTTSNGIYASVQPVFSSNGTITLALVPPSSAQPDNIIGGDFAIFAGPNGRGITFDAGYSPTNPFASKVVMLSAPLTTTINNVVEISNVSGSVRDSLVPISTLQLNTNIKAQQSANIGGSGAGPLTITVSGATSSSVAIVTALSSSNAVSVLNAAAGTNNISVTFTGDPGASAIVNYVVFINQQ